MNQLSPNASNNSSILMWSATTLCMLVIHFLHLHCQKSFWFLPYSWIYMYCNSFLYFKILLLTLFFASMITAFRLGILEHFTYHDECSQSSSSGKYQELNKSITGTYFLQLCYTVTISHRRYQDADPLDYLSTYHTSWTGHFMVFLVTSHVTSCLMRTMRNSRNVAKS